MVNQPLHRPFGLNGALSLPYSRLSVFLRKTHGHESRFPYRSQLMRFEMSLKTSYRNTTCCTSQKVRRSFAQGIAAGWWCGEW